MTTRRERVVLELEDNFSIGMVRAAGATKLLNRELNDLSGQAIKTRRSSSDIDRDVSSLGKSADRSGSQIDRLSGRLRIFLDLAAVLGPSVVPIAAVGIPAIAGLASQLGFAAVGAGVLIGAFQGVGDALKAMNKAELEPTAQNLAAAREAMQAISPDAQAMVVQLRKMGPELERLRDAGAEGAFPGIIEGLQSLLTLGPEAERIVSSVSEELGHIAADSGESLASARWADFFTFLATDAPSALSDMAAAAGNTGHALAELWMAFDPLNDDFSTWLVKQTADLDAWATKLRQTDGAEELFDYIRETGPQVAETFGAIANAGLQIVEATAPLGGPVLEGLESVADIIGAIADSNLGTPLFTAAAGMALLNRATSLWGSSAGRSFQTYARGKKELVTSVPPLRDFGNALLHSAHSQDQLNKYFATGATRAMEARRSVVAWGRSVAPTVAGVAGLAAVSTGLADDLGLTNTVTLGLAGSMAGPWGAALGTTTGLLLDAKGASDGFRDSIEGMNKAAREGDLVALQAKIRDVQKNVKDATTNAGFKDFIQDYARATGDFLRLDFNAPANASADVSKQLKLTADLRVAYGALGDSLGVFRQGVGYSMTDVDKLGNTLAPTLDKLGVSAKELKGMDGAELDVLAGRIAAYNAQADSAAGRSQVLARALAGLENQTLSTADGAAAFANAVVGMFGPGLDAEAATDQYTRSLRDLGKVLRDNGGAFEGNSKAALANREASRSWMSSFTDMLTKQAAAGTGSAQIARQINDARQAFIGEARAAGLSTGEIRRRLRVMGLTPKLVRTVFNAAGLEVVSAKVARLNRQYQGLPRNVRLAIRADGVPKTEGDVARLSKKVGGLTKSERRIIAKLMDQTKPVQDKILRNLRKVDNTKTKPVVGIDDKASSKIKSIQGQINAMRGRELVITTVHKSRKESARGNLFGPTRAYAYGDVANRHQAELAGPGPTRIWREPETQGEAYIPLANDDRRPRARAIASETVRLLGGTATFARGGIAQHYATGGIGASVPSIQVTFPTPEILRQSVEAANAIAASAARAARSTKEVRQANLEDLRARQRIRDMANDLRRIETIRVRGRDGRDDDRSRKGIQDRYKNVRRLAVRGLNRTVAQAELRDARAELAEMRRQVRTDALAAIAEAKKTSAETLMRTGDIFARPGVAGAKRSIDKDIADIGTYGQTISRLKAAGASPALLAQIVAKAEEGDFRSANRLGQALLAQPASLSQLNASLATLSKVSAGVAAITTDPRFASTKAWNPTGLAPKVVQVEIGADPSTWASQIKREVIHEVIAAIGTN